MSANITLSTQEKFLSAQNVHVHMVIVNAILKKGTRGSFQFWGKDDHDLTVTILLKSHILRDFGLIPNVIIQTSTKADMASRFLGLVGSLPLEEQQLWLLNQQAHDPNAWTVPHLLQRTMEHEMQSVGNVHGVRPSFSPFSPF